MTKRSLIISGSLSVLAVLLTVATIVSYMKSSLSEACEVCVTFNGRTDCREAFAKTRDEAIETATTNACALISGGMTDSIRCSNTVPDSVTCRP
jgi:hypothetical protein